MAENHLYNTGFSGDQKILIRKGGGVSEIVYEIATLEEIHSRFLPRTAPNIWIFHNGGFIGCALYKVQQKNEMIKITFEDGSEVVCSPGQQLSTTRGDVEAQNLLAGDFARTTRRWRNDDKYIKNHTIYDGFIVGMFTQAVFIRDFLDGDRLTYYLPNTMTNDQKAQFWLYFAHFLKRAFRRQKLFEIVEKLNKKTENNRIFIKNERIIECFDPYFDQSGNFDENIIRFGSNFCCGLLKGILFSGTKKYPKIVYLTEKERETIKVIAAMLQRNVEIIDLNTNNGACQILQDELIKSSHLGVPYMKIHGVEKIQKETDVYSLQSLDKTTPYITLPNGVIFHDGMSDKKFYYYERTGEVRIR